MATLTLSTAGTIAQDSSVGTLGWTNITNADVSNNTYATSAMSGSGGATPNTYYIKATNWGASLPSNARIDGITVSIEHKASASGPRATEVKLVKAGTIQTTNKGLDGTNIATLDTVDSYGGSADLWSDTWTYSDINNSGFGIAFRYRNNNASARTVSVDDIYITIEYTLMPTVSPVITYTYQRNQFVDRQAMQGTEVYQNYQDIKTAYDNHSHTSTESISLSTGDVGTYVSATQFTVPTDKTAYYLPGTYMSLTNSSTKYFVVLNSSYSAPNTTINVISSTSYSLSATTITNITLYPQGWYYGFPDYWSYTATSTADSGTTISSQTQAIGRWYVRGRTIYVYFYTLQVLGGLATGNVYIAMPVAPILNSASIYNICQVKMATPNLSTPYIVMGQQATNATTLKVYSQNGTLTQNWAIGASVYLSGNLQYQL